eukprot:Tbor_TRINITY_DN809_c0_g1::TRINITY_DN809_c0_g1_i1::g.26704::m.26704/K12829/SF3B2, SAP145, CUS1; splicing factor 3B subunit 2
MASNKTNKKQKQAKLREALSKAQERVAIEERLAGTKRTREEEEQNKILDKKRGDGSIIQEDGGDDDLGDLLDELGGVNNSNEQSKPSKNTINAHVVHQAFSDDENEGDTMDERRLIQQAQDQEAASRNKQKKYTPTELKRVLQAKLGQAEGASAYWRLTDVDWGTGNAPYPIYLTQMKGLANTVPVPSHWNLKRAFLCRQINREVSCIVPRELEATGVRQIRETNTTKPNLIPFARCFLSGSPLKLKRFGVEITAPGDVFYENKWKPKRVFEVGKLSDGLKKALGMGPLSPPPWLYAIQRMRELPPSYPNMKVPGYNAPIPVGGSWGQSEGQWGHAPRNKHGDFLFPEVGDTSGRSTSNNTLGKLGSSISGISGVEEPRSWGEVPPRRPKVQAANPAAAPPSTSTASSVPVPTQVRLLTVNVVQPDEFLRDHGEKDLAAVGEKLFSRRLTKQKANSAAAAGDNRDAEIEMMLSSFNQVYGSNIDQQHQQAPSSLLSDSRSYLNRI